MAPRIDELTKAALALPSGARALLADRLVESLDPAGDPGLQALSVNEAMRRRDEVRSGTVQPVTGTEAMHRVRRIVAP